MNSYLSGYEEYRGDFIDRFTGSMVSDRSGDAVIYGLYHLEPRGRLFVVPGDRVYEGMIVGEHNLDSELNVNPCKEKKLSNMRSVSKDEALTLTPIQPLTLERAIQYMRGRRDGRGHPEVHPASQDHLARAGPRLQPAPGPHHRGRPPLT